MNREFSNKEVKMAKKYFKKMFTILSNYSNTKACLYSSCLHSSIFHFQKFLIL